MARAEQQYYNSSTVVADGTHGGSLPLHLSLQYTHNDRADTAVKPWIFFMVWSGWVCRRAAAWCVFQGSSSSKMRMGTSTSQLAAAYRWATLGGVRVSFSSSRNRTTAAASPPSVVNRNPGALKEHRWVGTRGHAGTAAHNNAYWTRSVSKLGERACACTASKQDGRKTSFKVFFLIVILYEPRTGGLELPRSVVLPLFSLSYHPASTTLNAELFQQQRVCAKSTTAKSTGGGLWSGTLVWSPWVRPEGTRGEVSEYTCCVLSTQQPLVLQLARIEDGNRRCLSLQ